MSTYYKYDLLIEQYSSELLKCIEKSQYTLIKGPTGCGKSTFVPLLLNSEKPQIAVIEPRRIAVTSLHATLSSVTQNVGYRMRFNKKVKEDDNIIIYTDGAFLNDGLHREFDYIIVDEVHERSSRIDIILSLLKSTKSKVILMSATVNTAKIQKYFKCNIFNIKGISHPVEIIYCDEPISDYIIEAYTIIKEITRTGQSDMERKKPKIEKIQEEKDDLSWLEDDKINESTDDEIEQNQKNFKVENSQRDILVFLTGEEDICELEKLLRKIISVKVYKIYSGLSDEDQSRIYERSDLRKVILSTNICETSLTIPGIKYVIDCGLVKNKIYDGINYFGIVPISKESADQRLGRCNRIGPGVCYRLYTKETYKKLSNLIPEILVADLSRPFLQLINNNIDIFKFDFLDYPTQKNVSRSLKFLYNKGLIDESFKITKYGTKILNHPFEVNLGCFYQNCLDNDLGFYGSLLVSLISIDNYNFIKSEVHEKERNKDTRISDIQYLMNLFSEYIESNDKKEYCKKKELSLKNLDKAYKIFRNLNKSKKGDFQNLEKIFSKSFEYNLSRKDKDGKYIHLETGNELYIHPTSNFFRRNEKYIVFVDVICTTKPYARIVGKYYK